MPGSERRRICLIDAVRGFCVVSMVLFHLCYDLAEIYGMSISWFKPPFEDIWRASISWSFLFIAGLMCSFSRNNLKRGFKYAALALAIWAVTTIAAVDVPINFGIIFCMASSTLLLSALDAMRARPRGWAAALVLFACFILALGVPYGYIGVSGATAQLPSWLYSSDYFSWLGLPGPTFASGDYYPMIPFSLMYLSGASLGPIFKREKLPAWAYEHKLPALEFIGRHPLEIYIAHQPLLLFLAWGISAIAG